MGDTAEVVAKRYKISREAQDEYSLLQPAAHRSRPAGRLLRERDRADEGHRGVLDKKTGEIAGTEEVCCDKDECNRPDTTLEGLLSLKPHFDQAQRPGHR